MSLKTQSLVLMIVGILIVAISMLGDVIGIGANAAVIGWKQYFGAAVGINLILFGAHLALHHVIWPSGQKEE